MKSSKLLDVLHIVLHMSDADSALTSEKLAQSMKTNPVVVRRIMAGLREQGLVTSEKGHGGGWRLSCDLNKVTLLDIYKAVGSPTLLAIGSRNTSPECLVEQAVNTTTHKVFEEAEQQILSQFHNVTLADLHKTIQKNPRVEHEQHHKK